MILAARKRGKNPVKTFQELGVGDRIDAALELPPGTMGRGVHIELDSNREAVVDGCRGVLEYDDELVRLNTARGQVKLTGRGLVIRSLSEDQAIVSGLFLTIEFSS